MSAFDGKGTLGLIRQLCEAYSPSARIKTVAVVGNAPLKPSMERATAIDEADLVFRVNGFRLDRAGERSFGVRADVVVLQRGVRATPWTFAGYRERLYLLAEPGRMHWESAWMPPWWPSDLGLVPIPNGEVTLPAGREMGIDVEREAKWPTTGAITAWLALNLFPDATLLLGGFSSIESREQSEWRHASGRVVDVTPEHDLPREGALLLRWIAEGRVRAV